MFKFSVWVEFSLSPWVILPITRYLVFFSAIFFHQKKKSNWNHVIGLKSPRPVSGRRGARIVNDEGILVGNEGIFSNYEGTFVDKKGIFAKFSSKI